MQAVYFEKEKVAQIFATHGGDAKNTGSSEGQIALFSFRIEQLSKHLQTNKKDHSCRRALLELVAKRKRLLNYLYAKDIKRYRAIATTLGIRHT